MRLWLSILMISSSAFGATLNSDGSASDTQTQITAASNGDTVLLPSGGSYTWSADVSMPSTKYITLDLNGSTVTLDGAGNDFRINGHATGLNRVTRGYITRGSGYNAFAGPFKIQDGGAGGIRVDNITFAGSDVIIDIDGIGPGVMDHCTNLTLSGAQEFIHINGYGAGVTTGWDNDTGDTLAGSGTKVFYIEDCRFKTVTTEANCAWIQGYYGCRIAIRWSTFDYVSIDMHGTAGNIGARWWEIYKNTATNASGDNVSYLCSMRAGSGVVYSNASVGAVTIRNGFCEENSGYPADYQIGRGLSQALDPAYVWDNTSLSTALDDCDAVEVAGMVQLDRDVYASARPGYTGYTYPHPLRGETSVPNNIPRVHSGIRGFRGL